MKRIVLLVLLFALLMTSSTGWAEEAPAQQMLLPSALQALTPELNLFDVVSGATVEQRAKMSRLLTNKYPSLTQDLSALLTEKYPRALTETTVYIEHLVKTKYPEIPALILSELQSAPAVQTTIEDLVNKKYPDLIPELAEIVNSADPGNLQAAVAQLIQQKHPKLVADVLTVIRDKFPSLLTRLQYRVLSRHPGILIDVADMIQRRYPDFTNDVLVLILTEYPDLVSEVIVTLSEVPTADTAGIAEDELVGSQETGPAPGDEAPNAEEAAGTTTSGTGDVAEGE